GGRKVIAEIQGCDAALLNERSLGVLRSHLTRSREVIEVRELDQSVQPVVLHRTVRVADDAFRVAAFEEVAERAVAERVIQLADDTPVRRQLELEAVAEQPR